MRSSVVYRITFEHATESWVLRQDGSVLKVDKYPTKDAAIKEGRELAAARGATLVVHGKKGEVESEWSAEAR